MELISLVIVNYNNKDYLERCMNSILEQSYQNIEIIFIDNQSSDQSFEFMNQKYSERENVSIVYNRVNNGYAGGANQGIRLSRGEYIFILNPDIILEVDFVQKMYEFMRADIRIGALSGKLLKYDFEKNQKLNYIDSAGILMFKSTYSFDRGQNEYDKGQYDTIEQVFAVCGAAPLYRKSALESIKINEEYFDEDFFAYKEDVDLSWRLNLAGYKNMYYPKAVAYHGRGLEQPQKGIRNFIKARKQQSQFLRGISYRNRIMMIFKNNVDGFFKRNCLKILKRECLFILYAIIFEPFIFKYLKQAFAMRKKMAQKKFQLMNKHQCDTEMIQKLLK